MSFFLLFHVESIYMSKFTQSKTQNASIFVHIRVFGDFESTIYFKYFFQTQLFNPKHSFWDFPTYRLTDPPPPQTSARARNDITRTCFTFVCARLSLTRSSKT